MLNKIFKHTLLIAALFVSIGLFSNKTYANVYIDSSNNFVIHTDDKVKTSSIWYKTHGFHVSRCKYEPELSKKLHDGEPGNDSDAKANAINFEDTDTSHYYRGTELREVNLFKVPVTSCINGGCDGQWTKELEDALTGKGHGIWLKFDSIMRIYHGQQMTSIIYRNNPSVCFNPEKGIKNHQEIAGAEGWANPDGLKSHYNRYFYIGGGQFVDPIQEEPGENRVNIIGNTPNPKDGSALGFRTEKTKTMFATGNTSDVYDVSVAIPSGENVTNKSTAGDWYAQTQVWAHTMVKDYNRPIMYEIKWWDGDYDYETYDVVGSHKENKGTPEEKTVNDYAWKWHCSADAPGGARNKQKCMHTLYVNQLL